MISIIIPTLNEEKVLEKTLGTLKQLSICKYEIIVSDAKSTDGTLAIAKKYADKVVLKESAARETIAKGRNDGAARAEGDYLVFIDADVSIPDINRFFAEALGLFKDDKRLVGLSVFMKVFPEYATLSDKLFFSIVNSIFYVSNNILRMGAASGEFQMIRTGVFRQLGGYNEKMVAGEDNDMFSRLARVGRTRTEAGLHILHTSRRAHSVGWFNLLALWLIDGFYSKVFKRAYSKEWKVIR